MKKVTAELSNEEIQYAEAEARRKHKKLNYIFVEWIRRGLKVSTPTPSRRRFPKVAHLKDGHLLTQEETRAAIEEGRA